MRTASLLVAVGALALTAPAFAQGSSSGQVRPGIAKQLSEDKPKPDPAAPAPSQPAAQPGSDAGSGASDKPAVDPAKFEETKSHHKRRSAYVGRTREIIRNQVLADDKAVTKEEKAVINKHWAHAFRLIRIWNIAEGLGDNDTARKASTALVNADNTLIGNLKKLNKNAPKRKNPGKALATGKDKEKGGK